MGDLNEGEVAQVPNRVLMDQLGNQAAHFEAKGGKDADGRPVRANQSTKPQARGDAAPKKGGPKPLAAKKPRSHSAGAASGFGAKDNRKNDSTTPAGLKPSRGGGGRGRHPDKAEKAVRSEKPFTGEKPARSEKPDRNPRPDTKSGGKPAIVRAGAKPAGKPVAQKSRADIAKSRKPGAGKRAK